MRKKDSNGAEKLPVSLSKSELDDSDYWEAQIEKWSHSGLTQLEFCRRYNLNYKIFCRWKRGFNHIYPSRGTSIKLVEVKADVPLTAMKAGSFHSVMGVSNGSRGPFLNASGIRFWCGRYCIELGVPFSSETLTDLIITLERLESSGEEGAA